MLHQVNKVVVVVVNERSRTHVPLTVVNLYF